MENQPGPDAGGLVAGGGAERILLRIQTHRRTDGPVELQRTSVRSGLTAVQSQESKEKANRDSVAQFVPFRTQEWTQ